MSGSVKKISKLKEVGKIDNAINALSRSPKLITTKAIRANPVTSIREIKVERLATRNNFSSSGVERIVGNSL